MDSVIENTLRCLAQSPAFLKALLEQIPPSRYREQRVAGKWTIHEQVCHLVDAQQILMARFRQFRDEKQPHIQSHIPGQEAEPKNYLEMDMDQAVAEFPAIRAEMLQMLERQPGEFWSRQGRHDAFKPYNTRLLLMHTLNVDHTHFFSIEQLGLTRDGLEREIMVLP
jgi:uncharacterized damage-inducible protein DinB